MPVVKGDTVPLHRHAVSGRNGVFPTDEGDRNAVISWPPALPLGWPPAEAAITDSG